MDIRKKKYDQDEKQITTDKGEQEYWIQTDKVLENRRVNESIIFNLVQKISTIESMKHEYYKSLTEQVGVSVLIKYYIHSNAIIPFSIFSYFVLHYYKKNSLHNTVILLCLCSALNEGAKYYNIRTMDEAKTERYDEASQNYKILIRNYVKGVTVKHVLSSIFGLNYEKFDGSFIKSTFQKKMNDRFKEEIIFSKYI